MSAVAFCSDDAVRGLSNFSPTSANRSRTTWPPDVRTSSSPLLTHAVQTIDPWFKHIVTRLNIYKLAFCLCGPLLCTGCVFVLNSDLVKDWWNLLQTPMQHLNVARAEYPFQQNKTIVGLLFYFNNSFVVLVYLVQFYSWYHVCKHDGTSKLMDKWMNRSFLSPTFIHLTKYFLN